MSQSAFRSFLFSALLIFSSAHVALAETAEIFTPLGQVQIDGISADRSSGRSLACLTSYTFQAAAELLQDTGLTTEENSVPKIWKIHLHDSFDSLDFVLRSGESALFHTALMNPPAEIFIELSNFYESDPSTYLPAEIRSRCPGWSKKFVSTLGHEIAHGVEFALMGDGAARRLRWHEEGFAMLFEDSLSRKLFGESHQSNSAQINSQVIFSFAGTKENYDEVSVLFALLTETVGYEGLKGAYQLMFSKNRSFEEALKESSGISPASIIWLSNQLMRNSNPSIPRSEPISY